MTELLFPVVGASAVFFLAVPLLTVLAWLISRSVPANTRTASDGWRFAMVIGPTLGPLVWMLSAVVHQSESGTPLTACIVDHLGSELCRDVILFGFVLLGTLGTSAARRLSREHRVSSRSHDCITSAASVDGQARVARLCRAHALLAPWGRRITVVTGGVAPACTRGLLQPRVELEVALLEQLDDEELEAVLLHEVEHARARDPLRLFVAQVALSLNPLRRLLQAELSRYSFARETECDRLAVQRGADPLALARSIVAGAAPTGPFTHATPIGGHGIAGVRVRVALLLGYAKHAPEPVRRAMPIDAVTSCAALLASLPHLTGTAPLDLLHRVVESAAPLLGLG